MRFILAFVTFGLLCSMTLETEARARGGGLFKGGRSFQSAPASQAKSGLGVGVGVVVPVGAPSEQSSFRQRQRSLRLPPLPAEEPDAPKFHSAAADRTAPVSPDAKRPWCQDGKVVGRGSGFCEVTLASGRSGAPALLTLSN